MKKTLPIIFTIVALLCTYNYVRGSDHNKTLNKQPESHFLQTMSPPTLPNNWERIYIKNTGSFDLPPSMEIKKGKYRTFTDKTKNIEGFDVKEITAQQKGFNLSSGTSIEWYARVMLETKYDSPGEFEELTFNIFKYTKAYVNELNAKFNDQIAQDLRAKSQKISEWHPVKLERVNGMSCIHVHYISQPNNSPPVLVHKYIFQNYNRVHTFTLLYPVSDTNHWEKDFKTILESIRINTNR